MDNTVQQPITEIYFLRFMMAYDVEQMTINENVIYILSDKIIYQYELKDMNLYLKCKTQIKKSNEENYLSGIFYIKPESMKFTL